MYVVVSYDIGSLFLFYVFITICLSLPCLYACLLRAHTSFMLSSGWTPFPSQESFGDRIIFLGIAVYSLEDIQLKTLHSFIGIVLSSHWLGAYLHFYTYITCIIFLG